MISIATAGSTVHPYESDDLTRTIAVALPVCHYEGIQRWYGSTRVHSRVEVRHVGPWVGKDPRQPPGLPSRRRSHNGA
jgi:hypothetical protein